MDSNLHLDADSSASIKSIAESSPNLQPNKLNSHISRGFGFWSWKPQIILQTLDCIPQNSILFYCDIGCSFVVNDAAKNAIRVQIEAVDRNEIMGFVAPSKVEKIGGFRGYYGNWITVADFLEKTWSKADIFSHFGCLDDKNITHTPQRGGTIIIIKNCSKAREIITRWRDIFYNHFHLVDDSPSIVPNFSGFMENRHDQSIWSVLNKIYKLENFSNSFPIIASRNKIFMDDFNYGNRMLKMLRILGKIAPFMDVRIQSRKLAGLINAVQNR